MAFWSSEKLKQRAQGGSLIAPYDPNRVKHGGYELSVGPESFLTSDPSGKKQQLEPKGQVVIPPGQLGLLLTDEQVTVPLDAIGFISIKASIKFRGLVNVSGFHVDPGFKGRLKFSVYNAGSQNVLLSRNQPAFLIWFSDLDRETKDSYNGDHQDQADITAEDVMRLQGEIASPGQLRKEIQDLQNSLTNVKYTMAVLLTLVGVVLAAALRLIPLPSIFTPTTQPPPAGQSPALGQGKTSAPSMSGTSEEPKVSSPAAKRASKSSASGQVNLQKTE